MLALIRIHTVPWLALIVVHPLTLLCFAPFLTFLLKGIFIRYLGNPARVKEREIVRSEEVSTDCTLIPFQLLR